MGRAVDRKKPATYADVLAAPEHVVAELIDGELYTSPRPAAPHTRAASRLGIDIGGPFDSGFGGGPGGWIILFEPELHIVGQVLVPDLAGWRRERMPEIPDAAAFELAPDWVCEVLSPATSGLDRVKKMPKYAGAGVRNAWLVDPDARSLEVLRLDGDTWRLVAAHEGTEKVRAEPFEAVELDLSALWAR